MSVSVDKIKSNLLRPSLSSYFGVEISLPQGEELRSKLQKIIGTDQEKLNLLCSDTSLPGSQLTTMDINNDRTGVTEKHAYRRMFDDRIDFTFYVDADKYLPIRFFESWIRGIMNEDPDEDPFADGSGPTVNKRSSLKSLAYQYKPKYPNEYMANQGLKIFKFERDYQQVLTYEFIRSFPLSISSMPVSYSGNDLLKCTVSMSYIRYIQTGPINLSKTSDNDSFGSFLDPNFILSRAVNSINSIIPIPNFLDF
jgi:hypothetical protein